MFKATRGWFVPALWYVGTWSALVVVWALQVAPGLTKEGPVQWGHAFALAAINFYSTALVAIPLTVLAWKYGFPQRRVLVSALFYTVLIAFTSLARFVIFIPLLTVVSGTHYSLAYELQVAFAPQFIGVATLFAVILAIRSVQLANELNAARFAALQSQLQPHFLFNTLNAVSTLMRTDVEAADEMLARLCELLRATLHAPRRAAVPLEEELALASQYVEIMRYRFPGRISVAVSVPPGLRPTLVPPLVLQPLLENVFQHAMDEPNRVSVVSIEAERRGNQVVLTVRDDGPGLRATSPTHSGIGVENTRRRLEALFGPRARLSLRNAEAGGTEVTIAIPSGSRHD